MRFFGYPRLEEGKGEYKDEGERKEMRGEFAQARGGHRKAKGVQTWHSTSNNTKAPSQHCGSTSHGDGARVAPARTTADHPVVAMRKLVLVSVAEIDDDGTINAR